MLSVLPQLERAATLAYTSGDNEERKRNAELLSGFHSNKDCIPQCFAEADTRVLTDCGLLFLDQLEHRMRAPDRPLLFACYDTASKAIHYRPGKLVYRHQASRLLSFTAREEARRWREDGSLHSAEDDNEDGSGVSLRVTPDHRMFVQLSGEEQPSVRPAASLLPSCSCRPAQLCPHSQTSLHFVACAESGHAEVKKTASRSRVQRRLALADAQFPLFLELLGFWTAVGSLSHHSAGGDHNAVRFSHLQPHDQQWVAGLLPQCGLAHDDWLLQDGDLSILAPHWFDCFNSELRDDSVDDSDDAAAFSSSSSSFSPLPSSVSTSQLDSSEEGARPQPQPDSSDSIHCLPSWVLMQLSPQELRRVVDGLRRVSCRHHAVVDNVICTSFPRLRDQLMQALLHCGFSPLARLHHSGCWAVSWATPGTASDAASCWPSLQPQSDIRGELYSAAGDGRIWCVAVEHADHLIIAQRASRQCGAVLRQSRPVIVGQCRLILDQSENQYALLLAASSLLKLVTLHYHTMTLQHTIDINNYLLNFLAQKCTALPSFVLTPLIQTLTRIVKLGWRLDARFADVLSDVSKFLQATPRHHRVGLLIMSELIAEMNDNRTGESQVEHRRTARGFRDQTLLTVWTLSMQSIRQVAQQPGIATDSELDELMGAALALSNGALTFDFIGSLMDDSLDELAQMSLQIPAAWRAVMEDSATPQLYFDIIAVVRPARQAQAMEVLGGLATVRRSIFSTEEKRMAFLLIMARGVQTILASHSSILADAAVFHQFCITLARLKTNYPLPELSKLEIYDSLIGLIANFTLSAFKSSSSPNSLHYLLLVWSRVVGDLPYLKVACLSMQHQLLTDTGFMSWDDITQRLRLDKQQLHCEKEGSRRIRLPSSCQPLLVATFDAERRQLQYRPVDSLVLNRGLQEMITAADDKSNVHFSVTADHQMLVAASSLSSSSFPSSSPSDAQLSLLPARRLLDPSRTGWTFRCSAENGIDLPPADLSAFFPSCDIDSPAQQQRALELTGRWLQSNTCDSNASQSLPAWVWTLSAEQSRWLINGLHATSGSKAVIRAANSTVREEILRLFLHAGYTAVAADDGSIEYSCNAAVSFPTVSSACIRREISEEPSWCVSVPPHHLLLTRLTPTSRPVWTGNCSPFLEDFLPSISTVFIQSRLDAIVSAQREDALEELFEEPALSDQLKSLPALLKYNYSRSKEWLKNAVDKVMQDYTKSATANGGGGGGAAVRVSEGQLAMLIYIWAAIIGWEKDSPQQDKESSESYDAELCAWYFQSMPMVEYRLSSAASTSVFPQLALASLYFLQEFRKRFMQQVTKTSAESKEADMMNEMMSPSASSDGVNISFSSPPSPSSLASIAPLTTVVYPLVPAYLPFSFSPLLPLLSSHSYDIDLGSYTTTSRGSSFFSKLNAAYKALASSAQQQQQLKAHTITQTSIIANMLSTCLLFLNRFAGDESVVAACLELLENLSLGYASSQLLSSSEPIKQILSAHGFDAFPFLTRAGSQRAKLHTAFYLIIGRVLFKSGNVDNFDSFMLPFEQGFAALQSMNHLRSDASAQASVALCRKLQGLLEASASYSTYLLLWEWLHPAYLPIILRICETFADNAVVSSSVLQLFGELAYNRSQRIRFDGNSPNGIVLFRETSKLLTIYMHRLLAAKPDANSEQYKQKIKGVSLCLTTLTRALSGGYANFGIMALYEDHALSSTFNLMLQLIISLHLSDLLSYPMLAEPYFAFLEVSYKQHMNIMMELEQKVFWALVSSLHEGLQSFSVVCSTHSSAAIDFLFSYVVTEGRRKRRAASYPRLLKHMASSGGLLLELFTTLMNLYLFEQIPNAYSLSRPIFTLVVYSSEVWSQYQQRLMAVQGAAEAADRVRRVMSECMQGVQLTLEHEAKDRFFSHLTVLKNELAAFAVRLN